MGSTRAHGDRGMDARVCARTPVQLVREAVQGRLDEGQQWRAVLRLSGEEVKAMIEELEDGGDRLMWSSNLPEMLFYRWGELDPVAANVAARTLHPKFFSGARQAVIAAWINQGGGAAAWDAVKDEAETWACTRSVSGEVAEMLVASLSDRDDEAAFREVIRLNDETSLVADLLCGARARKAWETLEARDEFLAAASAHPEPFVLGCAYKELFQEWAEGDLEAARAGMSSMEIPVRHAETVRRTIESAERDREREEAKTAVEGG